MGKARIDLADIMGIIPAGIPEHPVQAVLVLGVLGVEGLVAAVHVYLAAVGLEIRLQVIHIALVRGVDELLFSRHSDALWAELFLDAGYTADEYYDAAASLNWLTNPMENFRPNNYIMPEDILIDLYENKLGSGCGS